VCAVREFVVNRAGDPPRHLLAGGELGPAHLRSRIGERDLGVGERALRVARPLNRTKSRLEIGGDAPGA
jgi:hypothetical protein